MAKSKANYVPNKNIKSITIQRGKKTTEVINNNLLDGAYVKTGVKLGKGGNSNEDYYENLMVYVQGKGQIYQGTSMKKAIEKANLYMSKNPNSEIAIVDEKYGDEYDLDGNLKDEYAKGGSMKNKPKDTKRSRPNIRKNPKIVRTQFEEEEFEYGKGGNTNELKAKKRLEELRKELRAEKISYSELVELQSLTKYIDKNDVELLEAAGVDEFRKGGSMKDLTTIEIDIFGDKNEIRKSWKKYGIKGVFEAVDEQQDCAVITGARENLKKYLLSEEYGMEEDDLEEIFPEIYRTGGVAGSKHVDVTKGYRLPHGYKAVKGDDKNRNYSKGKPKVRVDAGWRLPKGYEVVEGAYNMKYEDGGNMNDCYCYEIGGL